MQGFVCIAQTKHIDSLRNNILLAKNDDQKLTAIFKLCDESNSLNPDTLYKYCTLAKTIGIQKENKNDVFQSNLYKDLSIEYSSWNS